MAGTKHAETMRSYFANFAQGKEAVNAEDTVAWIAANAVPDVDVAGAVKGVEAWQNQARGLVEKGVRSGELTVLSSTESSVEYTVKIIMADGKIVEPHNRAHFTADGKVQKVEPVDANTGTKDIFKGEGGAKE